MNLALGVFVKSLKSIGNSSGCIKFLYSRDNRLIPCWVFTSNGWMEQSHVQKEDGSEAYFVTRFVMGWRREREVEERTLDDVGMDEWFLQVKESSHFYFQYVCFEFCWEC